MIHFWSYNKIFFQGFLPKNLLILNPGNLSHLILYAIIFWEVYFVML